MFCLMMQTYKREWALPSSGSGAIEKCFQLLLGADSKFIPLKKKVLDDHTLLSPSTKPLLSDCERHRVFMKIIILSY